ncbi:amidinotransferase [Yinghuangia soli]|uniref:Amidinotransferase n=1 Tax=Yinghuangia soli TaxID=2908204 RepID=A0AA41Q9B6_9ACTN|nr:amidinotransferase [Yinghuangia soli]MCF2533974.1 amidinotransferase [Yinghuangia soli]
MTAPGTAAVTPVADAAQRPIGVHREWDRLDEVVVGRPLDFVVPENVAELGGSLAFLPEGFAARWAAPGGRSWSQLDPEGHARCRAQLDDLAGFLAARGVAVHRPVELTPDEMAVLAEFSPFSLQIFVRDPMIVIGDTVVESSLRLPHRFKERFGLRPLMADMVRRGARHVVVPPGRPVPLDRVAQARGPFLEGGDVMLFGPDILVGVGRGGFATDEAGVAWLRAELGDGYRVHAVPLHHRVLHLDDGLAAVREGLAIVAREQFAEGLPPLLADWDLVEVTLDDALNLLAANVLVLAPGEVVVDRRVPDLAEALDARGVLVHVLDFDAVTPFAGGFRCSHHPLRRTPETGQDASGGGLHAVR